jgi:HSP20 family protein
MYKPSSSVPFVKGAVVIEAREVSTTAHWLPNTDVYLKESGVVIKVELAGMRSEDLEITVEDRRLRITGRRNDCCREGRCKFLVMEINYGPFERIIDVPAGYDLSLARAAYLNGFLRIDIPAQATGGSKKLKVAGE